MSLFQADWKWKFHELSQVCHMSFYFGAELIHPRAQFDNQVVTLFFMQQLQNISGYSCSMCFENLQEFFFFFKFKLNIFGGFDSECIYLGFRMALDLND